MSKCPECGKEIDSLYYRENTALTRWGSVFLNGRGLLEYDEDNEDRESLESIGYTCYECGEELFTREREATEFLKGSTSVPHSGDEKHIGMFFCDRHNIRFND